MNPYLMVILRWLNNNGYYIGDVGKNKQRSRPACKAMELKTHHKHKKRQSYEKACAHGVYVDVF